MQAASAIAPAAPAAAYWDAMESLDADLVASRFAARGQFQLANGHLVKGRDAIRRAFLNLFIDLETIERRPVSDWSSSGLDVSDADVTLNFTDGSRLALPATTILWTRDDEILACRVVVDPEPCLLRYF